MSTVIDSLERDQLRKGIPPFDPGDRVRVHFQVVEGTRRRTQVFEGIVIKRQGSGARETFTVRKVSFGVGVERTFPVHSPKVERIEVASRGEVRRAKLYYLRDRVGRGARVRERRFTGEEAELLALAAEDAKMADAEGTQDEAFVEASELPDEGGEETAGDDTGDAKENTDEAKPDTDEAQPEGDEAKPEGDEADPDGDDVAPDTDEAKPDSDEADRDIDVQPEGDEAQPEHDEFSK